MINSPGRANRLSQILNPVHFSIFLQTMTKILHLKRLKWRHEFQKYRVLMGKQSYKYGIKTTADTFNMRPRSVLYWRRKVADPTFHSNKWGGARNWRFTGEERKQLLHLIWFFCKKKPLCNLPEIKDFLATAGFDVRISFIRQIFKRWRWSWKKPSVFQVNKYRIDNILHYVVHCKAIQGIEKSKIKYLDESSFRARG